MKKATWIYILVWAVCLTIFNTLAFLLPAFKDFPKDTVQFWIGYALTTLVYIANLVTTIKFMHGNGHKYAEKRFYRIPLVRKHLLFLAIMTVIGCVSVIIPNWICAILCMVVIVAYLLSILKTSIAIYEVERVGENVRKKTRFIKMLTVDAQALDSRASSEAKALTHKVYEAIRYADPMSDNALSSVEDKLKAAFESFEKAIDISDIAEATTLAHTVLALVSERNAKCKALK